MKKNILKLIASASLTILIVGCGGGDSEDEGTPINPVIVDESIDTITLTKLRDVSGDQGYMLSVNIADALDPANNITYYFCEDKFYNNNDYLAVYENSYDYDVGFIQNVYSTQIWFYSQIGRDGFSQYWATSNNGYFSEGEIYPLADSIENDTGTIEINNIAEIDCSSIPKEN